MESLIDDSSSAGSRILWTDHTLGEKMCNHLLCLCFNHATTHRTWKCRFLHLKNCPICHFLLCDLCVCVVGGVTGCTSRVQVHTYTSTYLEYPTHLHVPINLIPRKDWGFHVMAALVTVALDLTKTSSRSLLQAFFFPPPHPLTWS